ncbi:MAG: GyrI-like domain-containing protein [Gemmataceae bacterium]
MPHAIRLEHLPALPLAVVRRRAAQAQLPKVVPEACGAVWNLIKANNIPGAGRHVALYLDGVINLEVGVELETPFSGCGELLASATPAGPVATTTHFGPYQQLHQAHQAILNWAAANGHTFAGPSWEIYGHWLDEWNADPSKIRTDIFYLLNP